MDKELLQKKMERLENGLPLLFHGWWAYFFVPFLPLW